MKTIGNKEQGIRNKAFSYLLFPFSFLLFFFLLSSCDNDDDGVGGFPEIFSVRKTTDRDSTFTGSFPGELILIQGNHLAGSRHLYFNEVEVAFNPNYVTDSTLIASIPEDIPLRGTDPLATNQIRLVTTRGEAVYSFNFYSPAPIVSILAFDMPAAVGGELRIIGENFYEVEAIRFINDDRTIETMAFQVSDNYSVISLRFPEGSIQEGIIEVVCVSGNASKEFIPRPNTVFFGVSSDMPIPGDQVIITGEYIFGVEKIMLPDGIEITNFMINDLNSELSFVMPKQVPMQSGKLEVVIFGESHTVSSLFYPVENVLADFDNRGWYSWGNDNRIFTPAPDEVPYLSSGNCINIFGTPGAWNYWWGNIIMGFDEYPASIDNNTPVGDIVLRFSFYTQYSLDKGYFQVQFGERWDAPAVVPEWRPYRNQAGAEVGSKPGRWIDYDIPLNSFGDDLTVYGDIRALPTKDIGFYFKNDTDDASLTLNVFFDNIRFVQLIVDN